MMGHYHIVEYLEKEHEDMLQSTLVKSDHEKYTIGKHVHLKLPVSDLEEMFGFDDDENGSRSECT